MWLSRVLLAVHPPRFCLRPRVVVLGKDCVFARPPRGTKGLFFQTYCNMEGDFVKKRHFFVWGSEFWLKWSVSLTKNMGSVVSLS